ncbi:MAG TPA: choice-of-anchor V domain-containing protein [Candidatus Eisenbacteria bacterium]|nr:choice-of-anchor V domain-containing protein [Candidatus Eisenbacteria bacterium]
MTPRAMIVLSLVAGTLMGWIAFDLRAPKRTVAFSYEPPTGHTGAPGEGVCSTCHTGGGSFDGSLTIDAPDEYQPGMGYTVTVTLQDPGQSRWGFELVPLRRDGADLVMAGSLTNLSPHTLIQEIFDGKQYISHTSNVLDQGEPDGTYAGTADGPVSWSFTWTAPPAGSDTVWFYAAGNAANNNEQNGAGDFVYTTNRFAIESSTSDVSRTTWGKIKMRYR